MTKKDILIIVHNIVNDLKNIDEQLRRARIDSYSENCNDHIDEASRIVRKLVDVKIAPALIELDKMVRQETGETV